MFFLLLSQQKRRLRFRNLLWSSFIPSGSLMISPDPPVRNCTLLYGTVRFTKKRSMSSCSFRTLMISPDPPIHNYTLLYGTIRFMKKERFSRSFPTPFGQYNHISRTRCIQVLLYAFMCFYVLYFRKKSGNRRCRTYTI